MRQLIVASSTLSSGAVIIPGSNPNGAQADPSAYYCCTQQHPPEPIWQAVMHDPVAFATVLLVIVTAGLWVMTFMLWREAKESSKTQAGKMERSAKAMEDVAGSMAINADKIVESVTLQRQFGERHLRALIDVQIGQAVYQDANNIFQASPRLLNAGNSVAKKVRWRVAAGILPAPLPPNLKFRCLPKELNGGVAIAPHQDGFMSAFVDERAPDDDVENIKRGRGRALYVWGYLIYDDGFGRLRRRTFVQQLYWIPTGESYPDGTPKEVLRGFTLPQHSSGN